MSEATGPASNVVELFHYRSHRVRTVTIGGAPWFVATDVCAALGLTNPSIALADLDEDERAKDSLGRSGSPANIISESGLYSLILRSRKPEARTFKRWVTHEVLPAIRRTGVYAADLCALTDRIEQLNARIAHLELAAAPARRTLTPADLAMPVMPDVVIVRNPGGFNGRAWLLYRTTIYLRGDLTPTEARAAWREAFIEYLTHPHRPTLALASADR